MKTNNHKAETKTLTLNKTTVRSLQVQSSLKAGNSNQCKGNSATCCFPPVSPMVF